jgi:acetylornithine deacetylase/succinyl-diaminopimelate desuccinylase-like protein
LNPAKDPIPGLRRDIILTATADEETGGEDGIALVLRDRKHWLDAAVGLTEAGGMTITAAGRRIYPLQVAEKGFARFNITVSGRWGHASMPDSDNALLRAAQIVERVSVPGPVQFVKENEALVGALRAALPEAAIARLERLLAEKTFSDAAPLNSEAPTAGCAPELLRALRAVLRDTFAPTIIASGIRSNVLPGSATLTVDSRILPGTTREQAQANMLERIGPDLAPFVKADLTEFGAAVSNPMDHEILGIASAAIRARDAEAILMPAVAPYATDAKITVPAGIPTYGFSPYLLDPKERFMERFHGVDERVASAATAAATSPRSAAGSLRTTPTNCSARPRSIAVSIASPAGASRCTRLRLSSAATTRSSFRVTSPATSRLVAECDRPSSAAISATLRARPSARR